MRRPECGRCGAPRRAKQQHKSLNEVVRNALRRGSGAGEEPLRHRNLRDLAGIWRKDREFDAAIRDQHRIDTDLWTGNTHPYQ